MTSSGRHNIHKDVTPLSCKFCKKDFVEPVIFKSEFILRTKFAEKFLHLYLKACKFCKVDFVEQYLQLFVGSYI